MATKRKSSTVWALGTLLGGNWYTTATPSDVEDTDVFSLSTLLDPRFRKNGFSSLRKADAAEKKLKELATEDQNEFDCVGPRQLSALYLKIFDMKKNAAGNTSATPLNCKASK